MRSILRLLRLVALSSIGVSLAALAAAKAPLPIDNKAAKKADAKPADKKKDDEELPLKTASTIEFTTDEGTWMSLDVSPDGTTLAFDLLGDLYTLPVAGGEAKRIVGGLSFESQPRFSPDGKSLAFISDRSGAENLWLAGVDGANPKPITKGRNSIFASPAWTPDGQYLVASKQAEWFDVYSIWLHHKDGGSGVHLGPPLPPQPEPGASDPPRPRPSKIGAVVSPDGRFVYYAQRVGLWTYNAAFPLWQVMRFDRETGDVATVTSAEGSAMRPVLSPDGKQLVYVTRFETGSGLRVRDLETSEERWLVYPVTRDDQESIATRDTYPGYVFTPDGKALIVSIAGKIQSVDFATGRLTPIPFSARVQAEIAPRVYSESRIEDGPSLRARLIRWPALSPDGKKLAFSCLNRLWLKELPDGAPRRLTDAKLGEFMPSWSRDGRFVVYVGWSEEGGQLYRVSPESGTPQQLTRRPAYYSYPVFTPDGSRIVFLSGATSEQLYSKPPREARLLPHDAREITGLTGRAGLELRSIPAEGGEATWIAAAAGASFPHFGREADRVYMTADPGTGGGLTSVRLDGLDRRTHLKINGTGFLYGTHAPAADEIKVAPDGQRVFVSLQNKHYLVQLPRAGRETIKLTINHKDLSGTALPVKKLAAEGGDYLAWTPDGKGVSWALGSRFYRQELSAETPETTELVVEAPRKRPNGSVLLSGARIVTMKGDEVFERGEILVTDNRIVAVGAMPLAQRPAEARVIDVSGSTVAPGFVDVHAHMWPPRDAGQRQIWQYLANLAYGVTTTRDPQSSTSDVFAYSDLVEVGEILGPRVLSTGPGVFWTSGLDDKDLARDFIKRYKEAYKTATLKSYLPGDRIVRQWVAMACKELGITPTTEGALDLKLDLTQMADGLSGSEHALPIFPLYKDVVQFVAQTKTFYTPTLLVAYGAPFSENYWFEREDVHGNAKLRRFVPHVILDGMVRRRPQWFLPEEYGHRGLAAAAKEIVRAGGRVCLGGHGQLQGLGVHWELWSLQSGGLTPHETLRAATLHGAEAIGLQRDIGSLEPGKLADLIVFDGNPLAEIRATDTIRYVMKNGELFEGATLDQVWPAAKELPKQFWWGQDPTPGAGTP